MQLLLKKTHAQVLSCEFCEIFKNGFFTEHLQVYVFNMKESCTREVARTPTNI